MAFIKDKPWICSAPYTGLTISPTGDIVLCCASDEFPMAHISEIDRLDEFYNSYVMHDVRNIFKQKLSAQTFPSCQVCWKAKKNGYNSRFDQLQKYVYKYEPNDAALKRIRFLEFTTSNICNQTCSTCSGKFSSKWAPYEKMAVEYGHHWRDQNHRFATESYRMSKEDINKILHILPHLEHLVIKGGEPFADRNNFEVLKELNRVNDDCMVRVCSNFITIGKSMLQLFEKDRPYRMTASIDGINDVYEWIRSTLFHKTVLTMQNFYNTTGIKMNIAITISLYNFFNLREIIDYFEPREYVSDISFTLVTYPHYCSPTMLPQSVIDETVSEFSNMQHGHMDNLLNIKSQHGSKKWKEEFEHIEPWIEYVNNMRGFDIRDKVPQLIDIKESYY